MTANGFRRIALGLDGAEERAHQGHPDFRVGGRIFASLGYPDAKWGMVVLTPVQQRATVEDHGDAFAPVKGAWGEQGCTSVKLAAADDESLGEAMTLAWQNAIAKGPSRPSSSKRSARPAAAAKSTKRAAPTNRAAVKTKPSSTRQTSARPASKRKTAARKKPARRD